MVLWSVWGWNPGFSFDRTSVNDLNVTFLLSAMHVRCKNGQGIVILSAGTMHLSVCMEIFLIVSTLPCYLYSTAANSKYTVTHPQNFQTGDDGGFKCVAFGNLDVIQWCCCTVQRLLCPTVNIYIWTISSLPFVLLTSFNLLTLVSSHWRTIAVHTSSFSAGVNGVWNICENNVFSVR